jgi:hypothetical protein
MKSPPAFWLALAPADRDAFVERMRRACNLPNWLPAWQQPDRSIALSEEPEKKKYRGRKRGALGRKTIRFREWCLKLHEAGMSVRQIAHVTGLSKDTIFKIVPRISKSEAMRRKHEWRRASDGAPRGT